jgi:hypothetical protein
VHIRATTLIAMLFGVVTVTGASAMTVGKPQGLTSAPPQLHVIDYKKNKSHHKRNRYTAGRHYNKAPGNWHRYNKRPGDWSRRGCIVVGPVWWCP